MNVDNLKITYSDVKRPKRSEMNTFGQIKSPIYAA